MTPAEWNRVTQLFERALLEPLQARSEFVERECNGNESRCRLVLSLISHHEESARETNHQNHVGWRPLDGGDQLAGGRFHVLERVGNGAFGTVYKALDRHHNIFVALKLLRDVDSKYLYQFKQEFRKSIQIDHSNIVRPYELFSDDDRWFFSMPFIVGLSMVHYVRGRDFSSRRISDAEVARLCSTLHQLVEAVNALHNHGLLHGDIKPENVLVSESGHVHLLDFGLVREIESGDSLRSSVLAGTPYYMSPEQVMQLRISKSSDWYSVGVMLYEALTGVVPFTGSLYQVLSDKCNRDVKLPEGEWGPELAIQLCLRLLSRDPQSRPGGEEIATVIANWGRISGAAIPATPSTSIFVGREEELTILRTAFGEVSAGHPVRVDVYGPSGIGKTAVIRRFLECIRTEFSNTVILTGRCYMQASVPFKALDEVIDATARYLASLDPHIIVGVLPRDFRLLSRVFPVMQQFLSFAAARMSAVETVEPQELRTRAIAALKELFARLADRRAVIVWVDDLQWGDPDCGQILTELLRPPGSPSVLVVLSYRAEDIQSSSLLQTLRSDISSNGACRQVTVGPLREERLRQLARLLAHDLSDTAAGVIAKEAEGSPLFLNELARLGITEGGRVTSFSDAIQQRVRSLDPSLRRLLETLAVAGQPLVRAVACEIADLDNSDPALSSSARVRMLLKPCGILGEDLDIYHDKVREAILASLSDEALRTYHRQLALTLQRDARVEPNRLLTHFMQAGDFTSGYTYAVRAAGIATECLAFHRAAELFKIARDLRRQLATTDQPPPGPDDPELSRSIADSLVNAGRALEAAHSYLETSSMVEGESRLDLRLQAADQMLRGGQVDEGLRVLRAVLREVGIYMPAGRMMTLAAVVLTRIRGQLRGMSYREVSADQVPESLLKKVDRLWISGATLTPTDPLLASYIHGQHYLLALRIGEPNRIALAFALEAVQLAMLGSKNQLRSRELLESARSIAERLKNPHAKAMAYVGAAGVAYFSGRMPEALRFGIEAEETLRNECRGVAFELAVVRVLSLLALTLTGHYTEYSLRLSQTLKEAEMNGDLYSRFALPISSGSWLLCLASDKPENSHRDLDEKLAAWGRAEFDVPHFSHWCGKVETYLYQHRFHDAWQQIIDGWPFLRRSLISERQFQGAMARHIRSRAAVALYVNGNHEQCWLNEIDRYVRHCDRSRIEVCRGWRALAEAATAACRHDENLAEQKLAHAEQIFRDLGWDGYAMAASFQRGLLVGGARGRGLQDMASEEGARLGIVNVPRFSSLLAPFPPSFRNKFASS